MKMCCLREIGTLSRLPWQCGEVVNIFNLSFHVVANNEICKVKSPNRTLKDDKFQIVQLNELDGTKLGCFVLF